MIRLNGQISHKRLTGRANISKLSEVKITLEDKTVIPTAEEQAIKHGKGFDGLGVVTVVGDENFIAKNIKNGVVIWGIEGRAAAPTFIGKVSGYLPPIYRGTARSRGFDSENLVFESSASGTVYEATE